MIRHYITIALRNLARQKGLAFINVAGLSIGIACFSLFLLYAVHEFSFDRFHKNAGNIYRVYSWWNFGGEKPRSGAEAASVTPLGPVMKQEIPDVEEYVRFKGGSRKRTRVGNEFFEVTLAYTDPQFFTVFTFPLIHGNPATALQYPANVVLTKEKALQLFGKTDVIGRRVEVKKGEEYQSYLVSGVAEDIPVNSSIKFEMLTSFNNLLNTEDGRASITNWHMTMGFDVYVVLRKGSTLPFDARMNAFYEKHYADEKAMLIKDGLWDGNGSMPTGFGLQSFRSMHTDTSVDKGAVSAKNIWILVAIAGSILLIACINFTTLAIGRSAGRAKEVGVRKVVGGLRHQLIRQFLAESLLLSVFSAIAGLALANVLLPYFNRLSQRQLHFSISTYPEIIALLAGLVLLVGILSGSYPAFVLSRFRPVEVLKNKIRLAGSNLFTKSLVTVQFVLSIGLIIATTIILQQLSFMHSKNLGLVKENVVVIRASEANPQKIYPLFRQALQSDPSIVGITATEIGLGANEGQKGGRYQHKDKESAVIEYPIEPDYLDIMKVKLIAGRDFDPAISTDSVNSILVNEDLAKNLLGVSPEQAIGLQITGGREGTSKTIIGVTGDFNFEDLTRAVRPQMFTWPADFSPQVFFVRIKPGDPSVALSKMEKTWKQLAPNVAFNYSFLDEKFENFYKAEKRWSSIVGWAGGICIFLACLGLFGLAALAAVNRTKEIGIRKVMGATVGNIVSLLAKDFIKLILIALVIASPVAWYFMNDWLQDYAYRIHIGWWVFVAAGIIAIGVALMTIGFQSVRAALRNPVKSLRTE
jgi:putative ABC transport system permease protein